MPSGLVFSFLPFRTVSLYFFFSSLSLKSFKGAFIFRMLYDDVPGAKGELVPTPAGLDWNLEELTHLRNTNFFL